jgi:hypothetical protein
VTQVPKPTQTEKEEFLKEHLPYEVDMLRATYSLLQTASPNAVGFALIESFCVHARNLIEFSKIKKSCNFDPRWFTENLKLDKRFVDGGALVKITEQISHLSANRRSLQTEKIGLKFREKVYEAIEDELERWEKCLNPGWRAHWKPPINARVPTPIFTGTAGLGATNQIIALGPDKKI